MANMNSASPSPRWGSTTKTIVGLTIAGLFVALLFYLRSIIGSLLLAVVLTYLMQPLAKFLNNRTRLSWRASVNLVFLILIILFLGTSTAIGFAVVQQAQSLIRFLERSINDLPNLLNTLTAQEYVFGPFRIDLGQVLDINTLSSQIISTAQPLLGRAGTLVGSLASSAANTATMVFFIFLVSYFTLADAGKFPDAINFINIPGYEEDTRRISRELSRIWNNFLRGQITFAFLVAIGFTVLLTVLGTRYSLALGLLTGAARFVPYLGQAISWVALLIVTLFQTQNYFGLSAIQYTLLVFGLSFVLDQIFDNLVNPRIMGQRLNISPGAVLVAAIFAANLIGIVGLVLAAPVLATIQMLGNYILRKMTDQEPWAEDMKSEAEKEPDWVSVLVSRLRQWWKSRRRGDSSSR
jgi:predicted PurR-regulated permease PerM